MSKSGDKRKERQTQEERKNRNALSRRQSPAILPNPFSVMRRFGEGMEELFDEFGFRGSRHSEFERFTHWAPQIEVFHRNGELHIRADLPGLKKDNVQVEVQDDSLILRGERHDEHKEEREGFYRTERSYGSFYREIPLPRGVDASEATAKFSDGVLEITMPATEGESRGRRLEIEDSRSEQSKQKSQGAGAGK